MLRIFIAKLLIMAFEPYKDADKRRGNDSRETVAHKVAWSAVEKKYHKNDKGHWVEK
ncbi:cation transporter [Rickettsia endosymbiont of Proechinophthirus fluctus]|uniref:Cation transport regulator ChaB-like protein n=2 Tax=spotted fever group TaxID=114277 RepID=Q92J38_RICCN|nr:cation transport regulator ChaB-like protein [Rickettsia conorii str. Malish 7]KYP98678.1 cation transporter [Rickettsia endosymbiont of Proechinophthirus fluctus]